MFVKNCKMEEKKSCWGFLPQEDLKSFLSQPFTESSLLFELRRCSFSFLGDGKLEKIQKGRRKAINNRPQRSHRSLVGIAGCFPSPEINRTTARWGDATNRVGGRHCRNGEGPKRAGPAPEPSGPGPDSPLNHVRPGVPPLGRPGRRSRQTGTSKPAPCRTAQALTTGTAIGVRKAAFAVGGGVTVSSRLQLSALWKDQAFSKATAPNARNSLPAHSLPEIAGSVV